MWLLVLLACATCVAVLLEAGHFHRYLLLTRCSLVPDYLLNKDGKHKSFFFSEILVELKDNLVKI